MENLVEKETAYTEVSKVMRVPLHLVDKVKGIIKIDKLDQRVIRDALQAKAKTLLKGTLHKIQLRADGTYGMERSEIKYASDPTPGLSTYTKITTYRESTLVDLTFEDNKAQVLAHNCAGDLYITQGSFREVTKSWKLDNSDYIRFSFGE